MKELQITKEMLSVIISMVFLGGNALLDIWKKKISIILTGIYIVLWLCLFLPDCINTGQLAEWLLGMLPGCFLLLIGILSKGEMGLGDGILVTATGLYMGLKITLMQVIWALLLAFFWGIALLCFGKKEKKYAFPFAPFLCLGLAVALI